MERSRPAPLGSDARRLAQFLPPIIAAGIAAVEPGRLVVQALDDRTVAGLQSARSLSVVAAGKAAVAMYRAFVGAAGAPVLEAIVSAPEDLGPLPGPVRFFKSAHPVPDATSVAAGLAALDVAARVPETGALVVLLSGGASALLAAPAVGITMEDKGAVTRLLLKAGCPIDGLNCVRKHLSRVKGGRLAAACPGRVLTLAISDVCTPIDDDPAVIGSGPTVADPTTWRDVQEVLTRYERLDAAPASVRRLIDDGLQGRLGDTPKVGDAALARAEYRVVGGRHHAMAGAQAEAERLGFASVTLGEAITGEARTAAARLVGDLWGAVEGLGRPACGVASGETTVVVRGGGRGGRNQELVLAAADVLAGRPRPAAFASAGTDGVDGPTNAAGAIADSTTLARAARLGLDSAAALDANDSNPFFAALGDLIVTGPTGTNVGDLHVLLVGSDVDSMHRG